MGRQIAAAAGQADVVVAALHWGAEYVTIPQAAPGIASDNPVEIAHLAVDSGADLVVGNHPHWVQGLEVYKDKLIVYSHGNFILDQMWSRETTIGVVGRYTFYDTKLVEAEFLPVIIEDYARPRPLEGTEAQAVLEGMRQASVALRDLIAARP
jgi:poly-gamma-glutamate synthesis protein (capsule biosynthesis protein)